MLLRYENVAQTVTYLLAFIGLIGLLRLLIKEKFIGDDAAQVFTRVLLCASFIGSFLCYLFWEAKMYLHFAFFPAAYSDGGMRRWLPAVVDPRLRPIFRQPALMTALRSLCGPVLR